MAFKLSTPTISKIAASSPLWIPILAGILLPPSWSNWTFTPRGIIYSDQIVPILLAPFAKPETILVGLSRLIQCALLAVLEVKAIGICWGIWVVLAGVRSVTGYLLTRSVGWAAPALFSHWALYESASGFGPALVAYLVVTGPAVIPANAISLHGRLPEQYTLPLLTLVLCWLECRPWTYGTALAMSLFVSFARRLLRQSSEIPAPNTEKEKDTPRSLGPYQFPLSALAVLLPWLIIYHLLPPARLPLPTSLEHSLENPLLDILILSFPRPVPTGAAVSIIDTTIDSFLPYTSPTVRLSIFTHSMDHDALKIAHQHHPGVTLGVDVDSHPNDNDGHYLHLAEAFRWMLEGESGSKGEWIMLVEDDFPLCHGDAGWAVITTAVNMLETDRIAGNIRSGFIGTGGSGIIVHRSYLPTLIFLLRSLSITDSPLHPDVIRRQPDEIIHDCILGRRYSFCERHNGDDRKLLISSRLVLDHIGGMATTTMGKSGNVDKWRCGWRHAFHGDEAVDVIVV